MNLFRLLIISIAVITCQVLQATCAAQALPSVVLSKLDANASLDGDVIEPKRICRISPGESNSVLKQGTLLETFADKELTGLDLFGARSESSLQSSVYYQVSLEDGVLQNIGKLTQLEYLNLHGVDLSRGVGAKCLTKLANLKVLRLNDCNIEIKQLLKHLPTAPNLEIVKVWNHDYQWPQDSERFKNRQVVGVAEVARLTTGSPKLREIYLESTERYDADAIAKFGKLPKLEYMHLRAVRNVPLNSVKIDPRQTIKGEELEKLFEDRGFRSWQSSAQRWKNSFTIPRDMINVQEKSTK